MGLGSSLLIIAVGAILKWAVTATVAGINLHTVGVILLIIGVVGFIISLFWIISAAERGRRQTTVQREVQYRDRAAR